MKNLNQVDPAIATLLGQERVRCDTEINLIASENYADKAVLQAAGSVLTNKYAEGYPGKRYYGGCHVIDQVELIAIERCKQLFGAQHANVQPHAGSQANMAVYFATLNPGDTLLGMGLDQGGHLTHGHPINFSGRLYNCVSYGVNRQTERIDYDQIAQLADTHKPKLIIAGGSAYSRVIDFEKFNQIAQQANALLLVDMAHIAGLVAAGLHPNPVPWADFVSSTTHKTLRGPRGGMVLCRQEYAAQLDKAVMPGMQGGPFMQVIAAKAVSFAQALTPEFKQYQQQVIANAQVLAKTLQELGYRLVTEGTDNHLLVVDLRSKGFNGRQAEQALAQAGIYVNRNTIPFDTEKPLLTSGIRLGTPALTTRGMKEPEMVAIAHLIDQALRNHSSAQQLATIKQEVAQLSARFYFYAQDLVHGFID